MKLENLVRTNQRRKLERMLQGMSKRDLARFYATVLLILLNPLQDEMKTRVCRRAFSN